MAHAYFSIGGWVCGHAALSANARLILDSELVFKPSTRGYGLVLIVALSSILPTDR
jgi:hypothetical protein